MANHKKTQKKRKPSRPLPKVGTPKDNEYVFKQSREDLIDFGLTNSKKGLANWLILAVILVVLGVGALALILFT